MAKIYLAGPMSGYPEFNFPAFDKVRDHYLNTGSSLVEVISPADLDRADGFDEKGKTGHEPLDDEIKHGFARRDLQALLEADMIVLLPGWQQSTGACNELSVARWLGLQVYEWQPWAKISTPLPAETLARYGSFSGAQESVKPLCDDSMMVASSEVPKPTFLNTRQEVLQTAEMLVNGDRNRQYGDPRSDFKRTARYINIHLQGVIERQLADHPGITVEGLVGLGVFDPEDVAIIVALVKISRLSWSPEKLDSWVDLAGYAACGADCAVEA